MDRHLAALSIGRGPPPARRAAWHALQEEGVDIVLRFLEEARSTFGYIHVTGHPPSPRLEDGGPVMPIVGTPRCVAKAFKEKEARPPAVAPSVAATLMPSIGSRTG